MCDELAELDWVVALTQLFEILNDVAEKLINVLKNSLNVNYHNGWLPCPITSRSICLFLSAKVEIKYNNTLTNLLAIQ